jgi:hypothetical protein
MKLESVVSRFSAQLFGRVDLRSQILLDHKIISRIKRLDIKRSQIRSDGIKTADALALLHRLPKREPKKSHLAWYDISYIQRL